MSLSEFLYYLFIYPLESVIQICFLFAYRVSKHAGLAIPAVSFAVSTLILPIYYKAEKLQEAERAAQKRLKPKIDKIKAVFKGDERFMILSTYYRQNNYHPLYALRTSFSLLIQVPFFIAAYHFLSHLDMFKNAPFFFIRDLNSPDSLLKFTGGGG